MSMWASVLAPAFVVVAVVMVGQLGFLRGSPPADLGARDGLLKAPSTTRNSVTSQTSRYPDARQRAYAEIAPLRYTGDAAAAITRLAGVVGGMTGAALRTATPDYLYATFTTRWLRFEDDVEFVVSPAEGLIHLRSASRLGAEDFGTNRRRIEAIRMAFEHAQ